MWNFDPYLFTQVGLDSGALTMLGAVVYKAPAEGVYRGNVLGANSEGAAFELLVTGKATALQANIDLATIGAPASAGGNCGCGETQAALQLHPAGTLIFHVSSGSGGQAAVLTANEVSPQQAIVDTRKLQPGDMFVATMLRPGTYRAESGSVRLALTVSYPAGGGKQKYVPPPPAQVVWHRDRVEPSRITVASGQGLIFKVEAPDTRIVITLEQADDGPNGAVRKRTGLRVA